MTFGCLSNMVDILEMHNDDVNDPHDFEVLHHSKLLSNHWMGNKMNFGMKFVAQVNDFLWLFKILFNHI